MFLSSPKWADELRHPRRAYDKEGRETLDELRASFARPGPQPGGVCSSAYAGQRARFTTATVERVRFEEFFSL